MWLPKEEEWVLPGPSGAVVAQAVGSGPCKDCKAQSPWRRSPLGDRVGQMRTAARRDRRSGLW